MLLESRGVQANESARVDGERRSVPEEIADRIEYEIAGNLYADGTRLTEIQLVKRFDVGRGSVREALRLLERRGSVELLNGRGAVVRAYPLERLTDAFNVIAILTALAVRTVTYEQKAEVLTEIGARAAAIDAMVQAGFSAPFDFSVAAGRLMASVVAGSGSAYLRSQVSAALNRIVWRAIWDDPYDYLTLERQVEANRGVQAVWNAIAAQECDIAEQAVRELHASHREIMLANLARQRGVTVPLRQIPLTIGTARASDGDIAHALYGLTDRLDRIEARLGQQVSAQQE